MILWNRLSKQKGGQAKHLIFKQPTLFSLIKLMLLMVKMLKWELKSLLKHHRSHNSILNQLNGRMSNKRNPRRAQINPYLHQDSIFCNRFLPKCCTQLAVQSQSAKLMPRGSRTNRTIWSFQVVKHFSLLSLGQMEGKQPVTVEIQKDVKGWLSLLHLMMIWILAIKRLMMLNIRICSKWWIKGSSHAKLRQKSTSMIMLRLLRRMANQVRIQDNHHSKVNSKAISVQSFNSKTLYHSNQ